MRTDVNEGVQGVPLPCHPALRASGVLARVLFTRASEPRPVLMSRGCRGREFQDFPQDLHGYRMKKGDSPGGHPESLLEATVLVGCRIIKG